MLINMIESLQKDSHYGPEASGIIVENIFLARKIYVGMMELFIQRMEKLN